MQTFYQTRHMIFLAFAFSLAKSLGVSIQARQNLNFFCFLFFSLTKSFESLARQTRIFGPECLPFPITNLTNFVTIHHPPDWARSGLGQQTFHLLKAQPHYFYNKKLKNGPELIRHCDTVTLPNYLTKSLSQVMESVPRSCNTFSGLGWYLESR